MYFQLMSYISVEAINPAVCVQVVCVCVCVCVCMCVCVCVCVCVYVCASFLMADMVTHHLLVL